MQLPKRFGAQGKQESTSYSAVEADADSFDAATSATNNGVPPPGWPVGAERIANYKIWIVIDCLLLLLPIAFIALAIIAVQLDGKDVSPYGRHVQDALLLGPTIYPLVFAALGGRALRKIALWRAGEGTTLGFLEHVLGSQSLVATIGHAITLHSLDVLTIALLAFWALSPLGGQSVLRLLREKNVSIVDKRPVYYSDVSAPSQFVVGARYENVYNRGNAVVSTALMTAENLEWTPQDAWSHPKIPRIGELELAESRNSTDRPWYEVDPKGNYSYASLAGINIINLVEQGSTNLTVPYEYMYFSCDLSPRNNISKLVETLPPQPYTRSISTYLLELQNQSKLTTKGWDFPLTATNYTLASILLRDRSFFMYTKGTSDNMESLLYGSAYFGLSMFLWECSMKSVMVEANILCQSDTCEVAHLRRTESLSKERQLGANPYGMVHVWEQNQHFIEALASLGGEISMFQSNPVDRYIYGVSNPWAIIKKEDIPKQDWTEYVGVPQKAVDMSNRMTKVLNTYLDSSRWPVALTQSDPFARKSLNTTGQPMEYLTMNSTEAVVSLLVPVYRVNAPWAALLVICSTALLLLGIFGIFVQLRTVVPDIFNHVSSLTRDNPHINAPAGGSGLDGAVRARLLKRIQIQLGDTEPQSETGYVAFRSVSGGKDCQEGRIQRERRYR